MESYIYSVKSNLDNARDELNGVLKMLVDSLKMNDDVFQVENITELLEELKMQLSILNNYIIPAVKRL